MAEETGKTLGRYWWIWVTLLGVLGVPAGCVAWGAYALTESGRAQEVPCDKAVAFAQGTLPKSAWDARCTQAAWLDTQVHAEFRMPDRESGMWLAATYPGVEPSLSCDTDLCLNVQYGDAAPTDGPVAVNVEVTYEGGGTALVRLLAFTT
ncbi:hypothetical protein [Streptomyces sp. NPDC000229]|uniref:hypothetical protein n=1 Tax=Streptomyces sp. NPDC000229 TaxID=3154247 RepID=UPI00332CEC97